MLNIILYIVAIDVNCLIYSVIFPFSPPSSFHDSLICYHHIQVLATFTQRKESATSTSFTLDETDAGVRTFPSLPESPVPRQTQREIDPLPQVGNEHVFHQQVCTLDLVGLHISIL